MFRVHVLSAITLAWALLSGACALSLSQRMDSALRNSCEHVRGEYQAVMADPGYEKQPRPQRDDYEERVAGCVFKSNDPSASQGFLTRWDDRPALRAFMEARLAASQGNTAKIQAALGKAVALGFSDTARFVSAPEFAALGAEPWFIRLAYGAWKQGDQGTPIDALVFELIQRSQQTPHLVATAADPKEAKGKMAVWFGRVQNAKPGSTQPQTWLLLNALDLQKTHVFRDRAQAGSGMDVKVLVWHIGGKRYVVTDRYREGFADNGRQFLATLPKGGSTALALGPVLVIGEVAGVSTGDGLAPQGVPVIKAMMLVPQSAKVYEEKRTETVW